MQLYIGKEMYRKGEEELKGHWKRYKNSGWFRKSAWWRGLSYRMFCANIRGPDGKTYKKMDKIHSKLARN